LIAADPELAQAVGADGVHWPETRLGQARAWRNRFELQTASAHSRQAIWRASQLNLDAVLASSVFSSDSPSAGRPLGVARFRRLVSTSPIPVYGLGGVTAQTSKRICQVSGLSGISGFT
jgi:thiamine-phosphate pyrophosphorylase